MKNGLRWSLSFLLLSLTASHLLAQNSPEEIAAVYKQSKDFSLAQHLSSDKALALCERYIKNQYKSELVEDTSDHALCRKAVKFPILALPMFEKRLKPSLDTLMTEFSWIENNAQARVAARKTHDSINPDLSKFKKILLRIKTSEDAQFVLDLVEDNKWWDSDCGSSIMNNNRDILENPKSKSDGATIMLGLAFAASKCKNDLSLIQNIESSTLPSEKGRSSNLFLYVAVPVLLLFFQHFGQVNG